jgi:hypothetical protein
MQSAKAAGRCGDGAALAPGAVDRRCDAMMTDLHLRPSPRSPWAGRKTINTVLKRLQHQSLMFKQGVKIPFVRVGFLAEAELVFCAILGKYRF